MKRYILTGAPGAGKTAILRQLELGGMDVVTEAATDLIALRQSKGIDEPWREPGFVEAIAKMQRQRLEEASRTADALQFHDRSVFCTLALATYLDTPVPDAVIREAERVLREGIYETRVFFIRNLGFVEPTAVRRISFEETLRFELIHEDTYRTWGFELMDIEPAPVAERVGAILSALEYPSSSPLHGILQRST